METDKNEDDEKKKKGIHTHAYTLFGFHALWGHSIDIMIFIL